ncbi:MAG: hypothetical protein KBA87_07595 [Lachnospiraceae bacterium]|nr:hypothetical protein [Lachnospiraceae bacterium]
MTDNKMQEELYDEDEVNIGEILLVLWRHIGAIIFATLIAGIIAILGTVFLIKPTYKSTFSAYINNRSQTDQNDVAALNSGDTTAAIQLTNTYAAILTSRPLVEQAVKKTKTDIRYEDVAGSLSTNVENNTSIITVNVVMDSPQEALELATSLSKIAPDYLAGIVEGSSMKVVSKPVLPSTQFSPNPKKNMIIGMIIGFILMCAIEIIMYMLDTRVKGEKDLEERFGISVVGTIPNFEEAANEHGGYNNYYHK